VGRRAHGRVGEGAHELAAARAVPGRVEEQGGVELVRELLHQRDVDRAAERARRVGGDLRGRAHPVEAGHDRREVRRDEHRPLGDALGVPQDEDPAARPVLDEHGLDGAKPGAWRGGGHERRNPSAPAGSLG
jgi:hypothetical protein